jgi:nucleoside-diphosphate kinase
LLTGARREPGFGSASDTRLLPYRPQPTAHATPPALRPFTILLDWQTALPGRRVLVIDARVGENDNVAMEQTLVIVKPDGVQRGLVGEIIARLERRGLKIVALGLKTIDAELAGTHYGEHKGKPFYNGLVEYIGSGPSVIMVLEGPDAIEAVRSTVGKTNPVAAGPGTIRGDFGMMVGRNLIHASDSPESAKREVALFFGDNATVSYTRAIDAWIVE